MVPTVALLTLPKLCAAFRMSAGSSSSASGPFLPPAGAIASNRARRSFMSISVKPFSSATRNATLRTPSCTSFRSSIRASNNGPISVTVARTGWPCSPNTSQNTVENWSGWKSRPISLARLRMKSFPSPTSEIPDKSPLISAANTGTPARAKPSAMTCSDTVLPVPVAPVTRPCRLASASASHADCSPLPMKIFSSVSAVLLSEVTIASPLRAHSAGLVGNHIASWHRNETVRGAHMSIRPPRHARFSYFILLFREEIENAAQQAGVIPAFTLALLQHLRRETALMDADRLYFRSQALKIKAEAGDPVKPVGDGAIYGRTDRTAGLQGRH